MELDVEKPQDDNRDAILKSIIFWIGGSIVAVFLVSLGLQVDFIPEYVGLYRSISFIAPIMVSGVPIILTSLLLLAPKWRRVSITRRLNKSQAKYLVFVRLSFEVILLNTFLIACISLMVLLIFGTSLSYLLVLSLTGFILSLLLSPLAVFLTLSIKNSVVSICCVIAIFWTFSFLYGMTPFQLFKGADSLLHPYHLYRFIAIFSVGIEFPTPDSMVYYVGIFATADILIAPLVFWSVICIVMIAAGAWVFPRAVKTWEVESKVVWKADKDESGRTILIDHTGIEKGFVKNQRYVVGVLFVIVLLVAGINFTQTSPLFLIENANEEILYQSPVGGEEIGFGNWLYGVVDFSQATIDGELWRGMEVDILSWGGAPQDITVSMYLYIVPMTLSELLDLDEADRANLIQLTCSSIDREVPYTGSGNTPVDYVGVHVWGIQFFNEEYEIGEFTFTVTITITVLVK